MRNSENDVIRMLKDKNDDIMNIMSYTKKNED